ncbi:tetratricopeptide repeat protein [Succinimonas amylolytica]|uniref:tetratricopeptide repeat protein n=1 Tax=Succinimonas amylolytica TaxID=83769 RepID=UPI000369B335|nr:tetratricopeptide repeat protein [Succinimonas amylolytica]
MFFKSLKCMILAGFLGIPGVSQALDCSSPEACHKKGLSLCVSPDEDSGEITDIYNDKLFSKAEIYFIEACKQRYPESCIVIGDHYGVQPGNGGMIRDFARAVPFYVQACELGSDDGCEKTIELYKFAGEYCDMDRNSGGYVFSEKCFTDARKYLDGFCSRGRATACEALGSIYRDKYGFEDPEYQKASDYFMKACDLKLSLGCFDLAESYERLAEHGMERDFLSIYLKTCDLKYDMACRRIGDLYLEGVKVPRDVRKGLLYLDKACSITDYEACKILSDMYGKGTEEIPQDPALSQKYHARSQELEQLFWDNCDYC